MIILTDIAQTKIKEIADAEGLNHSIRVSILGSGCAGFSHNMEFDNLVKETDEVVMINDIQALIDPISAQYLENVEIDYVEREFESGFKFNNPNTTGSCGCGSSISF